MAHSAKHLPKAAKKMDKAKPVKKAAVKKAVKRKPSKGGY